MDEVLMGRPLLHRLGLDVARHLESAREDLDGMDCSDIPIANEQPRLSRFLLRRGAALPGGGDPVTVDHKDGLLTGTPRLTGDGDYVQHGEAEFDPVPVSEAMPVLASTLAEEDNQLEARISEAVENGPSPPAAKRLAGLISEYREIWCISLGSEPPADLPPMVVQLSPDAVATRAKVRRYPPPQREFLREYTAELVRTGQAVRNPTSAWCSAALLVPKLATMASFLDNLAPPDPFLEQISMERWWRIIVDHL